MRFLGLCLLFGVLCSFVPAPFSEAIAQDLSSGRIAILSRNLNPNSPYAASSPHVTSLGNDRFAAFWLENSSDIWGGWDRVMYSTADANGNWSPSMVLSQIGSRKTISALELSVATNPATGVAYAMWQQMFEDSPLCVQQNGITYRCRSLYLATLSPSTDSIDIKNIYTPSEGSYTTPKMRFSQAGTGIAFFEDERISQMYRAYIPFSNGQWGAIVRSNDSNRGAQKFHDLGDATFTSNGIATVSWVEKLPSGIRKMTYFLYVARWSPTHGWSDPVEVASLYQSEESPELNMLHSQLITGPNDEILLTWRTYEYWENRIGGAQRNWRTYSRTGTSGGSWKERLLISNLPSDVYHSPYEFSALENGGFVAIRSEECDPDGGHVVVNSKYTCTTSKALAPGASQWANQTLLYAYANDYTTHRPFPRVNPTIVRNLRQPIFMFYALNGPFQEIFVRKYSIQNGWSKKITFREGSHSFHDFTQPYGSNLASTPSGLLGAVFEQTGGKGYSQRTLSLVRGISTTVDFNTTPTPAPTNTATRTATPSAVPNLTNTPISSKTPEASLTPVIKPTSISDNNNKIPTSKDPSPPSSSSHRRTLNVNVIVKPLPTSKLSYSISVRDSASKTIMARLIKNYSNSSTAVRLPVGNYIVTVKGKKISKGTSSIKLDRDRKIALRVTLK